MNPSPTAIAAIRSRVAAADWSLDDATIAAALNTPDRANPVPQPNVPVPLTVAGAMSLVSAANRAKVYTRPAVGDFRDDLKAGDLIGAMGWLQLALDAGDIAQSEFKDVVAAAQKTQPDPRWAAQISWSVATLGRAVDIADVHASRPGAN